MKSEHDKADPFSFEGPERVDFDGCTLAGRKEETSCSRPSRRSRSIRGQGTVRTITKQVHNESFFTFSPLKASGNGELLDENSEFT